MIDQQAAIDLLALAAARIKARQFAANRHWPPGTWPLPKRDGTPYCATSKPMEQFLSSRARIVGLIAGRGAGKSAGGAQKALKRIGQGHSGAIVAPNIPHLTRSTWPEWNRWCPHHRIVEERKVDKCLVFDTGAEVYYGGIEDPDAWRGPNLNWVWFDEAGRAQNRKAFDILLAAVRVGHEPQLWITSTPRGRHHWLHDVFERKQFSEDEEEAERLLAELQRTLGDRPLVEYHRTSIHDNRANLDPAFYASMNATYTGAMREQELEGRWVGIEGLVFDNWSGSNVDPGTEYDPALPVEWWVDDGYAQGGGPGSASYHPRVILFAQKRRGSGPLAVFAELVQTQTLCDRSVADALGLTVEALNAGHAARWPRNLKPGDRLDPSALPPGLHAGKGWPYRPPEVCYIDSSASELRAVLNEKADLDTVRSTHPVEEGIKLLRTLIRDGNGRMGLKVHPRCRTLIREMEGLHYAEREDAARAGSGQRKHVKVDDHSVDATRYGAWGRSR